MKKRESWFYMVYELLYYIVFEKNPLHSVNDAIKYTITAGVSDRTPQQYLSAIKMALESKKKLSEKFVFLIRGANKERTIRE